MSEQFSRRQIAVYSAITTGIWFMAAAKFRDGEMQTWWDWSGLVVGVVMLLALLSDLRRP